MEPEFHYRVHKIAPFVHIRSQFNPVQSPAHPIVWRSLIMLAFPLRQGLPLGLFSSRIHYLAKKKLLSIFLALSELPLLTEVKGALPRVGTREIFVVEKLAWRTGFCRSTSVFPDQYHSTPATTCCYRKAKTWSIFQKQCLSRMSGSGGLENYVLFSSLAL